MESATSRESYAAARERLAAYVRGAEPTEIAERAEEILAVADLLRREPRLRRALSDPARAGAERAGLLRGLLAGKVATETDDLLAVVVEGRWSAPSELLDATERLGVDALLAGVERAGELAEVEDELFRFGQIIDGDPELAAAIGDVTADPARRSDLARVLLAGKARLATIRLAELAVRGFGGRSVSAALSRLVELAAERRDRQVAHVTVAAPLTEEEDRRLGDKLAEMYGRKVAVKYTVDPAVLGGMSVLVGSDLYDGTVRRRLIDTRKALSGR
ncbi:ATP synthase F1 subcomplex delta subunit [Micromonospora pattaloongensis]|uniref:ATP synthase subunit delta n=1 Tax=Micromonospora pattaloongensis TaxID=405436 RepID=A0A1H3LSA8_9ACTN|nr:F0F1 ATP synthase subunit delta [Micromonospora pattaloongensis]SDY66868.1 ATP synthase F1 subcomplex delta subunit [Micromonospora pattaloongensis]